MEINCFFSCSAKYLNYALVTIASILNAKAADSNYTFYLYCQCVGEEALESAERMKPSIPEGSRLVLRDTNKELRRLKLPFTVTEGQETACGLLAPQLLPELDRILVLDSDLIVKKDLRELYSIAFNDALIAGVRDFDFIGQYYSRNKKYMAYYGSALTLNEICEYLQGGVILMNLAQMRRDFGPGEMFSEFIQKTYLFDEQDYLNKKCKGRKTWIDARWNVLHDNDRYRIRYVIEMGPKSCVSEYMESRGEPWIIHYAGTDKPWSNLKCDYAEEFWNAVCLLPASLRIKEPTSPKTCIAAKILRTARNELVRCTRKNVAERFWRNL